MKYTLLFIAALLTFSAQSQKVKKEGYGLLDFVQPRNSTALDGAETYALEIFCENGDAGREAASRSRFSIDGYSLTTNNAEADFRIELTEGNFKYTEKERKTNVRKYKDKNDVEKTTTTYYYAFKVSYHYAIVVYKDDVAIFREYHEGTDALSSKSSKSSSDANTFYYDKIQSIPDTYMDKGFKAVKTAFLDEFTDAKKFDYTRGHYVHEKKIKYPEFKEAWADFNSAMMLIKTDKEVTSEVEGLLNSCIDQWTEWVKDATPLEKKSKKNDKTTAAAYWNMAMAYFFLGEYEKAATHIEIAVGHDKGVDAGSSAWLKRAQDFAERKSRLPQ